MKFKGLKIGIPGEIMEHENRVAATPETVKKMADLGAKVSVQKDAGAGAFFHDEDYLAAGAEIAASAGDIFRESDIVLKVKEPQFSEASKKHEVELMKSGQTLVTFLHPANPSNHGMIRDLASRGVTGFSLDCIPRISRAQSMDALTSMSTVAGYKAIVSAAGRLPKFLPMLGTAVGMIQPAVVFVIGAGVAGLQALATAKRLGAVIYAADVRPDAVEQAQSLGAKIVETGVPAELAIGEGGYARHLPEKWLKKERDSFREMARKADIIILSALIPRKIAPILVDGEMVKSMKPGSAIVDIAIDQGGNCELTEHGVVCVKHRVSIEGTQNIPGSVPTSASRMFSENVFNFLSILVKDGAVVVNTDDEIIASALVTHGGKLVNRDILEEMAYFKEHGHE